MSRLLVCLLLPLALSAQTSHGYLSAGIGSRQSKPISQFALGGEWALKNGFGVGAELGLLAGHDSFGVVLANGYYHFAAHGTSPKVDPLVTAGAGATLDFGSSAPAVSLGGGVNCWFRRKLGLRLEIRDIVEMNRRANSRHFWGFRAGMSFR